MHSLLHSLSIPYMYHLCTQTQPELSTSDPSTHTRAFLLLSCQTRLRWGRLAAPRLHQRPLVASPWTLFRLRQERSDRRSSSDEENHSSTPSSSLLVAACWSCVGACRQMRKHCHRDQVRFSFSLSRSELTNKKGKNRSSFDGTVLLFSSPFSHCLSFSFCKLSTSEDDSPGQMISRSFL